MQFLYTVLVIVTLLCAMPAGKPVKAKTGDTKMPPSFSHPSALPYKFL